MRIKNVSVDCNPGYANTPDFEVFVDNYDELKPIDRLLVENDGGMWDVRIYEYGFVSFSLYRISEMYAPRPAGFCGAFSNDEFDMINGWSSNEMSFNELGLLDPVTKITAVFDNGYRIHLHMGLKELQAEFDRFNLPYTITEGQYGYIPVPNMDLAKVWECSGSIYARGETLFDKGSYSEHTGLLNAVDESHAKDMAYKEFGYSMNKPISVIER